MIMHDPGLRVPEHLERRGRRELSRRLGVQGAARRQACLACGQQPWPRVFGEGRWVVVCFAVSFDATGNASIIQPPCDDFELLTN